MGLLNGSLTMLLVIVGVMLFGWTEAQTTPARGLDAILQDYGYRAFVRPKTGVEYDGVPPLNLTGIRVSVMRLRSGSLFTRGVKMYNEFVIPVGVIETPYVERLVLVYQNLANWSMVYYPLTDYVYLAPVLGLLAYDATDLTAKNPKELEIRASEEPIEIEFTLTRSVPDGSVARCVLFGLNGTVSFTNVESGNKCVTYEQGHFSIVVESIAPSPAPAEQPPGPTPSHQGGGGNGSRVWIIVGSIVGGIALLVLLALLILWVWRFNKRKKMRRMEKAADAGEALHMTMVGNTKAPLATTTRTQPTLETEYVP
uniref:uncharacterized protein LOC122591156 n=1 Tax=Erigeron canadensis TaxID=72917 RepID=UPI001CB9615B|nr:uncharacterized protein LOC122591156 [Erigeron canadensis]